VNLLEYPENIGISNDRARALRPNPHHWLHLQMVSWQGVAESTGQHCQRNCHHRVRFDPIRPVPAIPRPPPIPSRGISPQSPPRGNEHLETYPSLEGAKARRRWGGNARSRRQPSQATATADQCPTASPCAPPKKLSARTPPRISEFRDLMGFTA
jgi:hypothetical protein